MSSVAARKRMIMIAWIIAAVVALASVADLILAVPFGGVLVMDVMFLLGAALIGYLAYDAYKDIT
jgi:hypothetical protein